MKISFKKLNFLVKPKNHHSFWNNFLNWEQNDLNFVTENGEENKIFVDVGAWIGPYTLIAASMGMKVYAFEPDKVAYQELKNNIELNLSLIQISEPTRRTPISINILSCSPFSVTKFKSFCSQFKKLSQKL